MEAATGFAKQMIEFQKSMCKNIFDSMAVVQAQAEGATSNLLDQLAYYGLKPEDVINDWIKAYDKGLEDYKKMIMEGFDNMEKLFPEE